MAKLLTGNSTNQSVVFSNSVWDMVELCANIALGAASNTNVELVLARYVADGIRKDSEWILGHGLTGENAVTKDYLESTLKSNSE
jgi:hypothetical protein